MKTVDEKNPSETLDRLKENLDQVEAQIQASCNRSGRNRSSVSLLPVVKYVGAEMVRLLYEAGIRDVAEGTVQGAVQKSALLDGLKDLRWHLVGHLQRNKAKKAIRMFRSIHSLDSGRLARKLEEELFLLGAEPVERVAENPQTAASTPEDFPVAFPVFYLEVNVSGESTKWGIPPEEAESFLEEMRECPRVACRIAGLMTMAPEDPDLQAARPHFQRLRELRDRLIRSGLLPPGAGLSMGMSGDFPVAVEEGATVVRVGTRIFQGLLNPSGRGGTGQED